MFECESPAYLNGLWHKNLVSFCEAPILEWRRQIEMKSINIEFFETF